MIVRLLIRDVDPECLEDIVEKLEDEFWVDVEVLETYDEDE